MRFQVIRSADGREVQIRISPQNDEESDILLDMYNRGGILALGYDKNGRHELILGTSPPERRWANGP